MTTTAGCPQANTPRHGRSSTRGSAPRLAAKALLRKFGALVQNLADACCTEVFVGGSFVTTKRMPGDIDALWSVEGVDPLRLHPVFWNENGLRSVKALFSADLIPAHLVEGGSGLPFIEFFAQARDGETTGIVRLDLSRL